MASVDGATLLDTSASSNSIPIVTPFYCEENCYNWLSSHAAAAAAADDGSHQSNDAYAIFITNPSQTALLRSQKGDIESDPFVVWDYHAVVCYRTRIPTLTSDTGAQHATREWIIIDVNSTLGSFVPLREYLDHTFVAEAEKGSGYLASYDSQFRVVPATSFLDSFASDRSHMLASGSSTEYVRLIPTYPALQGRLAQSRGEVHNLFDRFVDLSNCEDGVIVRDCAELIDYFQRAAAIPVTS